MNTSTSNEPHHVEVKKEVSLSALEKENESLKNKLRSASQLREQVRLQNVYVSSLKSELSNAKEKIAYLESQAPSPSPQVTLPESSQVSSAPKPSYIELEKANKELMEMCKGLEAELDKDMKEYDDLLELYNKSEEEHKEKEKMWRMKLETAAKEAIGSKNATPTEDVKSQDLQQLLERTNFQLTKEKEIASQLQTLVDNLRNEIEKMKEKQHLREQTINENYEEAMDQLRLDRQNMQMRLEKLESELHRTNSGESSTNSTPFGNKDSVTVLLAPLKHAERQAYEDVIRRLQMEVLELRQKAFVVSRARTPKSSSSLSFYSAMKEIQWINSEMLGKNRTMPEGFVKVLDFTDPSARKRSTRDMFSCTHVE